MLHWPGYRFTEGLTQKLNLHTLKAWILYKISQLYPTETLLSLVPILLNYVFYFFYMMSGLEVITIGNDCITLQFVYLKWCSKTVPWRISMERKLVIVAYVKIVNGKKFYLLPSSIVLEPFLVHSWKYSLKTVIKNSLSFKI